MRHAHPRSLGAMPVRVVGALTAVLFGAGCGAASESGSTPAAAETAPALDADVFIAPLVRDPSGALAIGVLTNISRRPGYDNQPHFTPDGSGLWYTVIDEHDGQADIWRYDFQGPSVTRVTMSNPESEYSATPLPDGSGISTIRVEADSTQRLWRFDADGSNGSPVFEDVAPVGYHAWADENTVVMFVLGRPATLQRGDIRTGRAEVLAERIGRSILRIPSSNDVSYVQMHEDGSSTIMRLPADGSAAEPIADGIEGGEFHAWTPDGTLLMAHQAVVYAWRGEGGAGWSTIADFEAAHISVSRLAVSADGSQIAIVGEPDMIDELPGG